MEGATQPRLDDERFVPALSRLVEEIHKYGALAFVELTHQGLFASHLPAIAPSDVALRPDGVRPHVLSIEEIEGVASKFAKAASVARRAGFDGVEVEAAHGLLVDEFLSPLANKRTDEYGGSVENRARFAKLVIDNIKQACGSNFTVTARLGVIDYVEGGVEPATDGLELAKEFERYGYAALHADVGFGDKEKRLEPMAYPQAWRSDLAKMLKDGGINIPVIGGAVRMALVPPGKSRMDWLVDYYTTILADLQVDIRTGVEANADIIMREHPDEVILAIGSDPLVPPVKGINGKNVVIYPAVLASSYPQNERVVVGGGGLVGSETALYLAENHNDVTIIEMLPDIAMGMEPISKKYLLRELEDHHVTIFRSSRIKELTENSVMF